MKTIDLTWFVVLSADAALAGAHGYHVFAACYLTVAIAFATILVDKNVCCVLGQDGSFSLESGL